MSSNQTLILNAIDTRMAALLPSYSRLKYSYEVAKNSARSDNCWGAGVGAGTFVQGVMQSTTLDQEFFVILTEKLVNRNSDTAEIAAIKTVYDNLDTVYRDFASSKLGIPNTVLVVSEVNLEEPVKIGENIISVRMNFIVKHRKTNT